MSEAQFCRVSGGGAAARAQADRHSHHDNTLWGVRVVGTPQLKSSLHSVDDCGLSF